MRKIWFPLIFSVSVIVFGVIMTSSSHTSRRYNSIASSTKQNAQVLAAQANDSFAASINLGSSLPVSQEGDNIDATIEAGEPNPMSGFSSVWYYWTAPSDGTVYVNTCETNYDTMIVVFTGDTLGSLSRVDNGDPDQGCDGNDGTANQFDATLGTVYRFQVSSWSEGYTGTFTLTLSPDLITGVPTGTPTDTPTDSPTDTPTDTPIPTSLAADNFADAIPVSIGDYQYFDSLSSATTEVNEPLLIQGKYTATNTVWNTLTSPDTKYVTIDTCGNHTDTMLAVFTGSSLDSLTKVDDNNFGCYGGEGAKINFLASAGVTYRIQLSINDGNTNGVVNYYVIENPDPTPTPPVNDDFANSIALTIDDLLPVTNEYNRIEYPGPIGATMEPGEPNNGGSYQRSIWYSWTNDNSTKEVWVDTCAYGGPYGDGEIDTVLGVYTGSSVGSLSLVSENDDWDVPNNTNWTCNWDSVTSFATFTAQPNVTYHFRIISLSYLYITGMITLRTQPAIVPSASDVPDGSLWCINHGGIARKIPYRIDDHDWAACWSWCNANMNNDMQICQMNGDGGRNCWLNFPPSGGMDTCQWIDGVYGPNTFPKGSYWGEITGYLMTLPSSLSGRLVTNENINVSINKQKGNKTIMLKDSGNGGRVSDVLANFVQDLNWTTISGGSDILKGKAFMHNLSIAPYSGSTYTLYVPIPADKASTKVVVCPGASSSDAITRSCPGAQIRTLSDVDTDIVTINGLSYWKLDNMISTGGYSFTTSGLNIDLPSTTAYVGIPFDFNVKALDSNSNVDLGYLGTTRFTPTANVTLPGDYTYTNTDNGEHLFNATFSAIGTYTITTTDTIDSELTTTSEQINVILGSPSPTVTTSPEPTITSTPTPTPTPTITDTPWSGPCDYCWTRTVGGTGEDAGWNIGFDSSNNIYVTGYFSGTDVNFNTTGTGSADLKTSNGSTDIYLTKFNSNGTYAWTKTFGGSGDDKGYYVHFDSLGNMYLGGYFSGTGIDFNISGSGSPDLKDSIGGEDMFITRYNSNGTYAWTRTIGSDFRDVILSIATDTNNSVYFSGYYSFGGDSTANFNTTGSGSPDVKTSNGNGDAFISKYYSDGSYAWTRAFGSTDSDTAWGMVFDSGNNLFVSGSFYGTVNFNATGSGADDIKTSNALSSDVFLQRYNSDGSYSWTKTFGGEGSDTAYGLTIDGSNNLYMAGVFESTDMNFNGSGSGTDDIRSTNGGFDIFLTKYTNSGAYVWTRTIGGDGTDYGWNVKNDLLGDVYLTGHFSSSVVDFNSTGVGHDFKNSQGSYDIFISKYSDNGDYDWTKTIGGAESDWTYGVNTNTAGDVFITGNFRGDDIDFNRIGSGPTNLKSSNGAGDSFLTKYTNGSDSGYCSLPTPIPTINPTQTPTPTSTITTTPTPTFTPIPTVLGVTDVQITQIVNGVQVCWQSTLPSIGYIKYGISTDDLQYSTSAETEAYIYHCQALTTGKSNTDFYFEIVAISSDSQQSTYDGSFKIIQGPSTLPETGANSCRIDTPKISGDITNGYQFTFTTDNNDEVQCVLSVGPDVKGLSSNGLLVQRVSDHFEAAVSVEKLTKNNNLQYQFVCTSSTKECSYSSKIELNWPPVSQADNLLAIILGPSADNITAPLGEIAVSTEAKTAIVGMVGVAAATFAISNPQILWIGLVWIYRRPKKNRFGLVFDTGTKQVVPFAVVRLLDQVSRKVIVQTVTDLQGRYHLLASAGTYDLEAMQDTYTNYNSPITLSGEDTQVTVNIGLSQNGLTPSKKWQLRKFAQKINKYIFAFGFGFSLLMLMLNFYVINVLIMLVYVFQMLLLVFQKPPRYWGRIVEAGTGRELKGVFISILDTVEQRQVDIQITDAKGRFGMLLEKQQYLLKANLAGYRPKKINKNWKSITLPGGDIAYQMPQGEVNSLDIEMELLSNVKVPIQASKFTQ